MSQSNNVTVLKVAVVILAIVGIIYGIGLLILPGTMATLFGATPVESAWLVWSGGLIIALGIGALLLSRKPEKQVEPENLISEIDIEEDTLYRAGRTNHQADLIFWYAAIVSSFVATILAALGKEQVPPWLTAAIAALPGLCASLQRVIDFRGRSTWYFQKAAHMKALLLNLKYQGMTVQDGAKKWGEIETSYEEIWPRLVKTGGAPDASQPQPPAPPSPGPSPDKPT